LCFMCITLAADCDLVAATSCGCYFHGMTGIYAMYFTGLAGSGHAVFVMKDGIVAGADTVGGVLDGTYKSASEGYLDVTVTLTVPPGAWLVTGAVAGDQPMAQEIKARLPENLGGGNPVTVQTPTGPVNVIFKRLRDLP